MIMKKSDFKIGQQVFFIYTGGNRRHHSDPDEILKGKITKIGHKYVTVDRGTWKDEKYDIETGYEHIPNYTGNYKMYLSKQDILDEKEANKLYTEISQRFSVYGRSPFSLEQLRKIKVIIEDEQKND